MSANPLALDNQLCFALYSTSLAMTQHYKQHLSPMGMTYPQYLIMLLLWEKDGVPLRYISERLSIKSGALTPVLKRMEAEGWLVRRKDPNSERSLSIELTEEGRRLKQDANEIAKCLADTCDLENRDITSLIGQLTELRGLLTK